MAWNSNPKVRGLGEYADKHGFTEAVVIGVRPDGKFETISYGKTTKLCKNAKRWAGQISSEIADGNIPVIL